MPIIRHDGTEQEKISTLCPFCGEGKIEREAKPDYDFDDKGRWFKAYKFTCQNLRCSKQWTEKALIQSK